MDADAAGAELFVLGRLGCAVAWSGVQEVRQEHGVFGEQGALPEVPAALLWEECAEHFVRGFPGGKGFRGSGYGGE